MGYSLFIYDITPAEETANGLGNDKNNNQATNSNNTEKNETAKKDPTKATGTLPYTGGELVIILSALAIVGLGVYLYRKNKDLRGI